jgi:hypothetical protein
MGKHDVKQLPNADRDVSHLGHVDSLAQNVPKRLACRVYWLLTV